MQGGTCERTAFEERRKPNRAYQLMMLVYALFIVVAFVVDTPQAIAQGLWRILRSRSVLITDYMAVGGPGAMLMNAAMVGLFSVVVQMGVGVRPNGATVMAMWLSTGFAMFGKNVFNMLPISLGVWLYAKAKKEPFMNYTLVFLLSATCTPVVSGLCFHPMIPEAVSMPLGIFAGTLVGFLFAPISTFTNRIHGGYDLYNMGFAGGILSTFIVSGMESFGLEMENALIWSTEQSLILWGLLYLICLLLIGYGLWGKGHFEAPKYGKITQSSGRLVSDFLVLCGNSAYVNMGLLGLLMTTVLLFLGASLNGPTIGGVFTAIGFGAFGKHLRNVVPVLIGALLCMFLNKWEPSVPSHILAILFSAGLAPLAGQFGWFWGIVAGFLHVNTVMHIGFLNSGLNLYNNGYAAGFVAILLVPVLTAFQRAPKRTARGGHGHES